MDEEAIRSGARAVGDALVGGDIDAVLGYLSDELKRNPGEVVSMLPLPATAVEVMSIERPAAAFVVVLKVVGETSDTELQTRWKDRDGEPRIVEVSHLSRTERESPAAAAGEDAEASGAEPGA